MKFIFWSYRFAEHILNSNLTIKKEIEDIISSIDIDDKGISRPELNKLFKERFLIKEWDNQPVVFDEKEDPSARIDFLKGRVGIEVAFSHSSFIGIDLLKFQTLSYSNLDKIDVGIYIVSTKNLKREMIKRGQKWKGSLTFEKVKKYLPHFKSAIQVPVFVIGLDV